MRRALVATLAVAGVVVSTACAAQPESLESACTDARNQLAGLTAIAEKSSLSFGPVEDQALDATYAQQLKTGVATLSGELTNPDVSKAFAGLKTAFDSFADTIAADGTTSEQVQASLAAVKTASGDLATVCGPNIPIPASGAQPEDPSTTR